MVIIFFYINIQIIHFQVDGLSKEQRKSIHTFLKLKYGERITTNTKTDDKDKSAFIIVSLSTFTKDS